jgi:hypothetical protein
MWKLDEPYIIGFICPRGPYYMVRFGKDGEEREACNSRQRAWTLGRFNYMRGTFGRRRPSLEKKNMIKKGRKI